MPEDYLRLFFLILCPFFSGHSSKRPLKTPYYHFRSGFIRLSVQNVIEFTLLLAWLHKYHPSSFAPVKSCTSHHLTYFLKCDSNSGNELGTTQKIIVLTRCKTSSASSVKQTTLQSFTPSHEHLHTFKNTHFQKGRSARDTDSIFFSPVYLGDS